MTVSSTWRELLQNFRVKAWGWEEKQNSNHMMTDRLTHIAGNNRESLEIVIYSKPCLVSMTSYEFNDG